MQPCEPRQPSCRYVVVWWNPIPRTKRCQYGIHTSYGSDHSRVVRLLILNVPVGVRYPFMPVRVTVGLTSTLPLRMTNVVWCVRSTQKVVPFFAALHAAVLVDASRFATSLVVGPARPWTGLMPYRVWNFLIAAQSAAD